MILPSATTQIRGSGGAHGAGATRGSGAFLLSLLLLLAPSSAASLIDLTGHWEQASLTNDYRGITRTFMQYSSYTPAEHASDDGDSYLVASEIKSFTKGHEVKG